VTEEISDLPEFAQTGVSGHLLVSSLRLWL